MSTDNRQLPDEQNKKMAKSKEPSLKTKQEGEPDRNKGVPGSGTSGSSDGSSSA